MTTSRDRPLITGASRGIGAATAALLAARGWDVAVNYARDAAAAEQVAADVRACGRRALARARRRGRRGSAWRRCSRRSIVGWAASRALINNAGIVDMKARLDEMSIGPLAAHARRQRDRHAAVFARGRSSDMSTRYGGAGGAIVNSVEHRRVARRARRCAVDYAASKGAIDSFDGRPRPRAAPPRACASMPYAPASSTPRSTPTAAMPTAHTASASDSSRCSARGTALEVAQAIAWLVSDESSYVDRYRAGHAAAAADA